ncbi:MAG: MATE family efflux transporter [Lachnospiraceae bacterium]
MRQVSAFTTYASLVVGVLFAGALLVFMQPILTLFGANEETYAFAKGYVFYISYGAPFIIWSAAASFVVRAEGASREAMIGSMIGTVANIVLDPVLISGFMWERPDGGGHDAGQYSGKHLLPLVFYKEEQQFFYFFKVFYL